jgi:hypothetical protein
MTRIDQYRGKNLGVATTQRAQRQMDNTARIVKQVCCEERKEATWKAAAAAIVKQVCCGIVKQVCCEERKEATRKAAAAAIVKQVCCGIVKQVC